jgi:RNA polymerase sigma-70 factor, ECF subfamily
MSESDYSLALKLKEGNKYAFDKIFFKYYNPLYRYAFNICRNKSMAEDSVQQTFIKIWKNNTLLISDESIGKLLFTYTYNQLIDEIRKENTRKKYEGLIIENTFDSILEDNKEERLRVKAIIESAIDKLPEKTKEVFRLAKQEGLSYDEIADYLKVSQKTVENQLGNAYKKLREYLSPYKDLL